MKLSFNNIGRTLLIATVAIAGWIVQSCQDEPDKYEIADGIPEVLYVRVPDLAASDSLLTGAYMDNTICLVGNNLRSITEMYFNDQKATLNTSFMTDHTVLVSVPKTLSDNPTDKIYMINASGETTTFDFKVLVPAPVVDAISCEYTADGDWATITGDYLLSYQDNPMTITMAGNLPVTEIKSVTKTAVTFRIPEGSQKGYINVTSKYGTSRSKFQFRDDRNILFDWDGVKGLATGHGWRNGNVQSENPTGINANYVIFKGNLEAEPTKVFGEDAFSFNYWPEPTNNFPELSTLIEGGMEDWKNMAIKFEYYIPTSNPWMSCSLQMIFTSNDQVTFVSGNNSYLANADVPRGLWTPWTATGSWDTGNKWMTATIPLANFKYTHLGASCTNALNKNSFTGLTFFIYGGSTEGIACSPIVCIDNIRVVPVE